MWRDRHPVTFDDATEEIREALEELAAGDTGVPFEEFDRGFRRQHSAADVEDATKAVLESLADYEAGDRGISIDEADRLFRQQFPKPQR